MKLALFSETDPTKSYEILRFIDESKKMNIDLAFFKFSDIKISFSNNEVSFEAKGEDIINSYDCFILRAAKRQEVSFEHYKGMIAYLAERRGKFVLNSKLHNELYNWSSKIFNYVVMADNQISIIPSLNFSNFKNISQEQLKELTFPLIAKRSKSSHGNGVFLQKSYTELEVFLKENSPEQFLIQPYIQSENNEKEDIRIITIGEKVIGGYKKVAAQGSIVSNLGAGGHTAPLEVNKELEELCVKITKAFKSDYLGIDIIYDGNTPRVLEINKAAQFEGFEQATGINLARMLLEYCLIKTNNK